MRQTVATLMLLGATALLAAPVQAEPVLRLAHGPLAMWRSSNSGRAGNSSGRRGGSLARWRRLLTPRGVVFAAHARKGRAACAATLERPHTTNSRSEQC